MSKFQVGERVKMNTTDSANGLTGVVSHVYAKGSGWDYQVKPTGKSYSWSFREHELESTRKFKTGQLVRVIRTGILAEVIRYAPEGKGLPIVVVESNEPFPIFEKDLEAF